MFKIRKKIEIKLINGRAIINPAKTGFLTESQLANAIIKPEKKTFKAKENILTSQKVFYF